MPGFTLAWPCVSLSSRPANNVREALCELQRPVFQSAESQAQQVERVVLIELPWPPGTLMGKRVHCTLDIARGEGEQRLLGDGGIAPAWGAVGVAMARHVVEQSAD